jgi:hypothetical protein
VPRYIRAILFFEGEEDPPHRSLVPQGCEDDERTHRARSDLGFEPGDTLRAHGTVVRAAASAIHGEDDGERIEQRVAKGREHAVMISA